MQIFASSNFSTLFYKKGFSQEWELKGLKFDIFAVGGVAKGLKMAVEPSALNLT